MVMKRERKARAARKLLRERPRSASILPHLLTRFWLKVFARELANAFLP
jgi:hypothetical protein